MVRGFLAQKDACHCDQLQKVPEDQPTDTFRQVEGSSPTRGNLNQRALCLASKTLMTIADCVIGGPYGVVWRD